MSIQRELKVYMKQNLKENTVKTRFSILSKLKQEIFLEEESCLNNFEYPEIQEYIQDEQDENKFQKLLFHFIDSKSLKDSDVYNKVHIDRRLFSKIRNDVNYHPSKETIILLSLALNLKEEELESLLNSASYSLPKNNTFDLIIRFCFQKQIYNLNQVNEFLYEYGCKMLN